jgi:hypothetical protein
MENSSAILRKEDALSDITKKTEPPHPSIKNRGQNSPPPDVKKALIKWGS